MIRATSILILISLFLHIGSEIQFIKRVGNPPDAPQEIPANPANGGNLANHDLLDIHHYEDGFFAWPNRFKVPERVQFSWVDHAVRNPILSEAESLWQPPDTY